jgi:hypothetical protein
MDVLKLLCSRHCLLDNTTHSSQCQSYFTIGGLRQSVGLGAELLEDHDQSFFSRS